MSTRPSSDEGFLSRWARRKADARTGAMPGGDATASVEQAPQVGSVTPELAPAAAFAVDPAPAATSGFASTSVAAPAQDGSVDVARPQDGAGGVATAEPAPAPTLADVAALTRDSDFSPFVARGVGDDVKRAAMKKLFTDPRYNVMDGLDTYIGDYNTPDPIPPAMLRQLMAGFKQFVDPDSEAAATTAATTVTATSPESPSSTSAVAAPVDAEPAPHAATQGQAHDHPDLQLQQDDAAGRRGAGEGARA